MKVKNEFVYKCLEYKDAGIFKNENGQEIKYNAKYVLKLDELTEKGINSIELSFPTDNQLLVADLKRLNPYDKINLQCEVVFYRNGCKLVPLSLEKTQSK